MGIYVSTMQVYTQKGKNKNKKRKRRKDQMGPKTHFWDGSRAKNSFAFSYEIGFPPSIKSDKSMSKVGPRLLNSDPYDT